RRRTGGTDHGIQFIDSTSDVLPTYSGFDIAFASLDTALNTYKTSGGTATSGLSAVFLVTSGSEYQYNDTGSSTGFDTLYAGAAANPLSAGGGNILIWGTRPQTFS